MAGGAEKKARMAVKRAYRLWISVIVTVNVAYFMCKVVLFPGNTTFGKLRLFGLVISSLSYYVGLQGTIYQAMQNIEGGYYFDILAITSLSQALCCYSDYLGWAVYMLLFVIGGWSIVSQFLGSKEPQPETNSVEKERKAKRRAEKKQKRRVKYI
eukprot:15381_1